MHVFSNTLEMVGRTPMLEVNSMDTGPCRLFLKLELMNPGGSIKDRIGMSMIEEAERIDRQIWKCLAEKQCLKGIADIENAISLAFLFQELANIGSGPPEAFAMQLPVASGLVV